MKIKLRQKDNFLDINYDGGGVMINGVEILDGKGCLVAHPIHSLYFSDNQMSPAEKFGGIWELLAENVTIPLGTEANVVSNGTTKYTGTQSGQDVYLVSNSHINVLEAGPASLYSISGTTVGGESFNYKSGLSVDLSKNTISGIYVWRRKSWEFLILQRQENWRNMT